MLSNLYKLRSLAQLTKCEEKLKMKKETKNTSRREFLKLAAAGAPAAAAVTVSAKQVSAEEIELGSGIQNTEHVLKYYETAKF